MKPIRIIPLFCCILIMVSACSHEKPYHVMTGINHTVYHIKYRHDRMLDEEIKEEFRKYYHSTNPFDSTSVISRINRNDMVEADSLFMHVFHTAMEVSAQTGGAFDVTCAPLINLWGFGFQKYDSVTPQMIDSILGFVGYQKVRLHGSRVVKDDSRILLNFSALGDGVICDIIARLFDREGIADYLIEIGGEVMAKGKNPQGQHWRIGIVKPKDDAAGTTGELEQIIQLPQRLGLATSGNYRNFYVKDGKKYAHTINPLTGYPAGQDILSATIIAKDCILADAYATAFMVLGSRNARLLQQRHPEIEYFIIFTDSCGNYKTGYSQGMKEYMVLK